MTTAQKDGASQLDAAPGRFLDQIEELRMNLSSEQLIHEAIEVNHGAIGEQSTLGRYRGHLVHYSQYLTSEAERIPVIRDALSDPETAYVLLTRTASGPPLRRSRRS